MSELKQKNQFTYENIRDFRSAVQKDRDKILGKMVKKLERNIILLEKGVKN